MAGVAPDPRDFIERTARQGWKDGQRDCLLWLGLWTLEVVGVDGGAEWRGRYRTPLGRLRAMKRSGGMMACIERGAAVAGLIETADPQMGAIGLVEFASGPCGSIFNGERWCALTRDGVVSVRAVAIRAWDIP